MKIKLTSDNGDVFERDIAEDINNLEGKIKDLLKQAKDAVTEKADDLKKGLSEEEINSIRDRITNLINGNSESVTEEYTGDDCCSCESCDIDNDDHFDLDEYYSTDYPYDDDDDEYSCSHTLEENSTDPSIDKNYSDNKASTIVGGKRSIIINGDVVINILGRDD